MADPRCTALGLPVHLHQEGRNAVSFHAPEELLFRRFNLQTEAEITACINFSQMSVNRGSLSAPEDALRNDDVGGWYEGCGVIGFPVSALAVDFKTEQEGAVTIYALQPHHVPKRCNFSHAEVLALKNGEPQARIKPPTVKLALRRALREHIRICLPRERERERFPAG